MLQEDSNEVATLVPLSNRLPASGLMKLKEDPLAFDTPIFFPHSAFLQPDLSYVSLFLLFMFLPPFLSITDLSFSVVPFTTPGGGKQEIKIDVFCSW